MNVKNVEFFCIAFRKIHPRLPPKLQRFLQRQMSKENEDKCGKNGIPSPTPLRSGESLNNIKYQDEMNKIYMLSI